MPPQSSHSRDIAGSQPLKTILPAFNYAAMEGSRRKHERAPTVKNFAASMPMRTQIVIEANYKTASIASLRLAAGMAKLISRLLKKSG